MKGYQFLFSVSAVVLIIVLLDLACHPMMDMLRKKALLAHPDNYEMTSYYGVEMASEDMLILGASTATHHYDPSLLHDSLHFSVRNLGKDGASLYCQICQLRLILDRHVPRWVIWDVSDDCLSHNKDWSDFMEISDYWPYRQNDYSNAIIQEMGPYQPVYMHSWLYRYNTKLPEYLFSFISGRQSQKGYVPLPVVSEPSFEKEVNEIPDNINEKKVDLFESLLSLCIQKGTKVILVTSPRFSIDNIEETVQYRTLCEKAETLDIPYYNYHKDPRFFNDISLFRDVDHLNQKGAELFTVCLIQDLSQDSRIKL